MRLTGHQRSAVVDTEIQIFRDSSRLAACAVGDPSVTLLRNDRAFCLLLARAAHEDCFAGRLHLEDVSHLHVFGPEWSYTDFASVALFRRDNIWLAQDAGTGRYFRNPSVQPYRVAFITTDEFTRLRYCRAEGLAYPVFEFAQRCFGRLPGFSSRRRVLQTPEDYATAPEAVPPSEYVFAARHR